MKKEEGRSLRESEQLIVLLVNNLIERVLQDVVSSHTNEILLNTDIVRAFRGRRRESFTIGIELLLVVARVRHGGTGELLETRILPLGVLSVVIDVEDSTVGVSPLLPADRQRADAALEVELRLRRRLARARVYPCCCLVHVVDKEQSAAVRVREVPAWWQWWLVRLRTHTGLLG